MFGLAINVDGLANALGVGYYILVYGIGLFAMFFSVAAYQFKYRKTIILSSCLGQFSWVLHFLLQGDLTSAIACALSSLMLAVFSQKDRWKWVTGMPIVIAFIVLISGFSILSFKVWSDIFPISAGIFAVIANSRTSEKRLRQIAFFWCVSWLFNSIFKLYPMALATDIFCTASTVIALIRYRKSSAEPSAQ